VSQERVILYIDDIILFCLCILVIFLPIAHTETIRAFCLGIAGGLWVIKMILTRQWLFSRTPLDLPILLFSIGATLSLFTAVDFWYSLDEFQGEWLMGIFAFYLTVNNIRPDRMRYILGALLIGNLAMVGYGIYDFFHSGGSLLDYRVRAGSLHSGFGTFSTYLITVLPYLLAAIFLTRRRSSGIVLLPLFLLNLFSLYLTHSRGAWVGAAALLFIGGWRFLPRRVFIPLAALACLAIILWVPTQIFFHYTGFTSPSGSKAMLETGEARWKLALFSLEKLRENPFQMHGFGRRSFVKKYNDLDSQYRGAQLWHAHNTFLNIAIQTGVQGLVFFCFLLYRLLKYCREKAKMEKDLWRKFYLLGTFMMVITFFVRNLSEDFFVDDSALLFWFLVGMAFAIAQKEKSREREGR